VPRAEPAGYPPSVRTSVKVLLGVASLGAAVATAVAVAQKSFTKAVDAGRL
jgi:hypothetical protein